LIGNYPQARSHDNHMDMARQFGYYGVLSLGVGTLIVAGGIDLSIGSLVGLCAVSFGMLLEREVNPWLAAGAVVGAAALAVLLHATVYGRYLYAIGANEQAARYAGIPTGRYKILSYMISSACAGLGGVLFLCENDSAMPTSAGSLDELYAITGAVLGGCSLKGGVGSVVG